MARGSIVKRYRKVRTRDGSKEVRREPLYYVVYRVGNRQKWEAVGPNKKEAEERLNEIISEINSGTYRKIIKSTFRDFAERWLEDYAAGAVKESTLSTYRTLITHRLLPALGDLPMSVITPVQIQRFMSKLLSKVSAKTVNNHLILLKTMFKHAKRWGYVRENPVQDIEAARIEHKEMDFLEPHEVHLLLKHADEPYRTLFLTAVVTGLRRSELLGLQWGDIDWRKNFIYVRRGLYWRSKKDVALDDKSSRWQFTSPKSKRSIRAVVLSPTLRKCLELHRISSSLSSLDLIFCNSNGDPMDPNNMVNRKFIPALARAGLRKIRFHDLRHTNTALLISQGENVKFIQGQLGHASVQTTLDRYGHLLPNNQQGVGARIDEQLFGSRNGKKEEGSVTISRSSLALIAKCG